jgi:hypothetical protein
MNEVEYLHALRARRIRDLREDFHSGVEAVTTRPLERAVRRHPWGSALASVASGFCLGVVLRRAKGIVRPLARLAAGPASVVLRAGLMQAWAGRSHSAADSGAAEGA